MAELSAESRRAIGLILAQAMLRQVTVQQHPKLSPADLTSKLKTEWGARRRDYMRLAGTVMRRLDRLGVKVIQDARPRPEK
jgi:hypothetical protein